MLAPGIGLDCDDGVAAAPSGCSACAWTEDQAAVGIAGTAHALAYTDVTCTWLNRIWVARQATAGHAKVVFEMYGFIA